MEQRKPQQQPQPQRRRPVNVAEIMAQIRRRIEARKRDPHVARELEDLANMRLKPLPDPEQVKSLRAPGLFEKQGGSLEEQLKPRQPEPRAPLVDPFTRPQLEFDKPNISVEALFYSSRGGSGRILMVIRRILRPVLKLFVNVDAFVAEQAQVNQILRNQAVAIYERHHQQLVDLRDRDDQLLQRADYLSERQQVVSDVFGRTLQSTIHYVKILHQIQTNLVAELTKLAIENQNLKSRLAEMDDRVSMQGKREAILEEQVQQIADVAATSADASASNGSGEPQEPS